MILTRDLAYRLRRYLTAPQRCQHPGCGDPATFYDAALDLRTCPAHRDYDPTGEPCPAPTAP